MKRVYIYIYITDHPTKQHAPQIRQKPDYSYSTYQLGYELILGCVSILLFLQAMMDAVSFAFCFP